MRGLFAVIGTVLAWERGLWFAARPGGELRWKNAPLRFSSSPPEKGTPSQQESTLPSLPIFRGRAVKLRGAS